MRTIKELLQLMLDNKHLFQCGLCHWLTELFIYKLISRDERIFLLNYIKENKPEYKWYNPYMLLNHYKDSFYWIEGCITPRINWLKHHISIN